MNTTFFSSMSVKKLNHSIFRSLISSYVDGDVYLNEETRDLLRRYEGVDGIWYSMEDLCDDIRRCLTIKLGPR